MAERRIGTTGLVVATSLAVIAVVSAVVDLPLGATGTATTPQPRPAVAGSSNGPSAALTGASPTSTDVAPSLSRGPGSVSPAPAARIPSPSIAFESRVHDYQVRYPAGWTLTPAAQRPDPDLLAMKAYRWTGSARRLAKAKTLEAFVTRQSANACPAAWEPTAIDGRRALQRAGCGRVDAAVMVGQMGYRFALEGSGPYERVLLYGRIAATIELPEPFVSTVHDFTLMIPPAWEVERGTAPTEPDRFYGPRDLRFTVTMRRESAEVDPVAWAAGHFDRRSSGLGQYCRGQSGMRPVKDHQFRRWTIDGHPAALRSACGHVDAAVAAGKRTYELSLMSPHVGPGGDDAAFALLSPRIDVGTPGGSGPVWTQTFRSRLHGYVLHYPQDWSVSAASTVRAKDVFHTSRSSSRLSITVRSKPRGQRLELFAERLLPHHVKGDGCHWNSTGIIWIPASRERFEPLKIAGHDAVVRSECDFIEAVIDLDDRALVLVFHSAERIPGAERTLFDLFTGAIEVTERS